MKGLQAEYDARPADKEYMDMLNDTPARQAYFSNLATPSEGDHKEVTVVKNRINKLIEQEIELAGFKGKLSEEE